MIRHTVVFNMKHAKGSPAEAKFIEDALALSKIPGVTKFERLREIHPKNNYTYGFSMEFADQAAYDAYSNHPDHLAFVTDKWVPNVADFLEIDYTPV